jgi:hypothetical protein
LVAVNNGIDVEPAVTVAGAAVKDNIECGTTRVFDLIAVVNTDDGYRFVLPF